MNSATPSANIVASLLLDSSAVLLNPSQPFTWASGIRSPIYCDNRVILSYPALRDQLWDIWQAQLSTLIQNHKYALAGVATAGIPHASVLADRLGLPCCYVRNKPKDHGTQNLIEGRLNSHDKVIVIEDLISTAQSSMQAVQALRSTGVTVDTVFSIFTYQFAEAQEAAEAGKVKIVSLTNYETLIAVAAERRIISSGQIELLNQWRLDPKNWLS